MKPNALLDTKVTGTMTGEIIPMDVDPDAKIHMMTVFTNLYSDRLLACIREYSTNALDANREAGVDEPIRVETPNFMSPYLTIADNGKGLTLPQIRNVYSKYLSSTKRDSNDFNGMLGVGSKAALTYTPNFTVISVAEGMRHTVSVSLNEEGVGEMQVVDSSPVTALTPSGVTIQIPIARNDQYLIGEKAREFFSWWDEGTVLLNGAKPNRKNFTKVIGDIYTADDLYDDYIVMAGVAYPIPGERKVPEGMPRLVYFAKTGEINFAPSREAIRYDARAKKVIDRIVKEYTDNFTTVLQSEIDKTENKAKAWLKARQFWRQYPKMELKFTYDGEEVPHKIGDGQKFRYYAGEGSTVDGIPVEFAGRSSYYFRYYHSNSTEKFIVVTGVPDSMTPHNRKKLRDAAKELYKSDNFEFYLTKDKTISCPWVQAFGVITWDKVNEISAEKRKASKTPRDRSKYEMFDAEGLGPSYNQIEDGKKYLLYPASMSQWPHGLAKKWLKELGYDYLIRMPENRRAKFLRLHPGTLYFKEAMGRYGKEWADSVPYDRLFSMAVGSYLNDRSAGWIRNYKFDDPEIQSHLDRHDPELDKPYIDRYYELAGVVKSLVLTDVKIPDFLEGYPTLSTFYVSGPSRAEIINALYHYRKEKKNGS